MGDSIGEVVALLNRLASANNDERSNAELSYRETILKHKETLIISLIWCIKCQDSVPFHIRKLAVVLLRRILDGEGLSEEQKEQTSCFQLISAHAQASVKSGLLEALALEKNESISTNLCEVIGDLACYSMELNECQDILQYMYSCLQNADIRQRCIGFTLLGMLSESYIENFMENSSTTQILVTTLAAGLQFCAGEEGRRLYRCSLGSLSSILTSLSRESQLEHFVSLVPTLFNSLQSIMVDFVTAGGEDTDEIVGLIQILIEITEERVYFYEAQLPLIFENVVVLLENKEVPNPFKRMLLEFMTSICANAPKKTRKLKGPQQEKYYFAQRLFPLCLQMMLLIPDEPQWETLESVEGTGDQDGEDIDPEGHQTAEVGEMSLDRMCQALGLRSTYSVVSSHLISLFQHNESWKYHYTALRYLGNYMEVSAKIERKEEKRHHHQEVVATLHRYLGTSTHARVKAAGFFALSQFLVFHGTSLSKEHLESILTLILSNATASNNPAPRVRRNVVGCLINLIDCAPQSFVEPKVGDILNVVIQALSEGPRIVQEFCVSVITALAETMRGDQMAAYYDALMPILKTLLAYSQNHGLENLWGQTLECCAMLGESSGKMKFLADATEMMNSLVNIQSQIAQDSDIRKYLLKAWVRIARCLGAEFLPFLQMVMDNLLTSITQDVTSDVQDIDPEDVDEESSDIHMIETEKGWIAVRTSAVEEQASACQLMVLIIEKLQEHFYPYVEVTTKAMLPLLTSPHDDVRSFCIVVIPELVRSTAKAMQPDRTALLTLTEYCMGQLIQALEKESIIELVMTGLQSLRQMLIYACTNWARFCAESPGSMQEPPNPTPTDSMLFLNVTQMESFTRCTQVILRESIQRRAVLRAEAQIAGGADEDDAADEQMLLSESMELHFIVAELIGSVLRTHGPQFYPVLMKDYQDILFDLSQPYCLKEDRQFSLYVICDIIEFALTRETAPEFFNRYVSAVLETVRNCEDAGPRQAASYAVGVAAEKLSEAFAPFALEALGALSNSITMGEEPGEPRGHCTDNSVQSVGIILEKMDPLGVTIDYDNIWNHWLNYLPLKHDTDEGKKVIKQLLKLLQARYGRFFSHDRTIQGLIVLLQVFDTELSSNELNNEIIQMVHSVHYDQALMDSLNKALARADARLRTVLDGIFAGGVRTSTSPGPSAPIHDVLFRM